MAFPLTRQGFIVKPLDGSQTLRPGKPGNVLPFLVTLQNLDRDRARKLFVDTAVLFDLPHATLCIYHEWYVKLGDGMVTQRSGSAAARSAVLCNRLLARSSRLRGPHILLALHADGQSHADTVP